jgi:hypothetical protein
VKKRKTYKMNVCRCVFCGAESEFSHGYAFYGYDRTDCVPGSAKPTDHKWKRIAVNEYDLDTDAFIGTNSV